MFSNFRIAGIAIALTLISAPLMAQTDGRNVQIVTSGNAYGNALGTFRNMGNGSWMEDGLNGRQGQHFFQEVGRDQWSVYLHDASRGVDIQIDLWQQVINYRDANYDEYV